MAPQTLDHSLNTYLALSLRPTSSFMHNPANIAQYVPAAQLTHIGNVGQLADVHLFSVPKSEWERVNEQVLATLKSLDGVESVEVQVPKQRAKRGVPDEL